MLIVEAKYMFSRNSGQFCDQCDNCFLWSIDSKRFWVCLGRKSFKREQEEMQWHLRIKL